MAKDTKLQAGQYRQSRGSEHSGAAPAKHKFTKTRESFGAGSGRTADGSPKTVSLKSMSSKHDTKC